MNTKSLRHSEEYLGYKIQNLRKDYEQHIHNLQENHDLNFIRWKITSEIGRAFDAAYREELESVNQSYIAKMDELHQELNALRLQLHSMNKEFITKSKNYLRKLEQQIKNFSKTILENPGITS